ncbi:hypothetical protein VZQ01_13730 [Myxococcus faecalis]|jgi:hypothetical protein|uniref:hypothetical protein n=1 Tax=Myxococcus faecalis TaxID=3115646 RepID=UPI0024CB95FE|nr:STAS/SEC14 domain-containing protein [Myxococcus sp. MH1]
MARDWEQEWSHGAQRAWLEAPDILWARFRGAITEDTSRWSCGLYQSLSAEGRFYLAADIADSQLSPESRRYLVEHAKADWFLGIVYVGAALEQKATTKSLMVGSMLTGGRPLDVRYVDTLDEARAWIQEHRALNAPR